MSGLRSAEGMSARGNRDVRIMAYLAKSDRARARRAATALLLAGAGTAALTLGGAAQAANECGAPPSGAGTVTCPAGTYNSGITYTPVDDLTVVAPSGVDANDTVSITGAADYRFEGRTGTTIDSADGPGLVINGGSSSVGATSAFAGAASVGTTSDNSIGIDLLARQDATVDAGTVRTSGANSIGISAQSKYADVTIDAVRVETSGIGATGIRASSNGDNAVLDIDSGVVVTLGEGATGIRADSRGTATITSDSVTTGGDIATGISWAGRNGPVTIDSGTVVTTGDNSVGIFADHAGITSGVAENMPLTIISDSIETSGSNSAGIGVSTANNAGVVPVVIQSGDITTRGTNSDGIVLDTDKYGASRVNITSSGTITTEGANSDGIDGYSTDTLIIDANDIVVSGAGSVGIRAVIDAKYTYGPVDAQVASSASGAAQDVAANGGIEIRSTGVTATNTGAPAIDAQVNGPGDIDIFLTGQVATTGNNSRGIFAELDGGNRGNISGDIAIRVETGGGVSTTGKYSQGILATLDSSTGSSGNIDITIAAGTTVSTLGQLSDAVIADSRLADPADTESVVTITNSGSISTTGSDSDGIDAESSNRVLITSNQVQVSGAGSVGIRGIVFENEKYYSAEKVIPVVAAADVAVNGGVSITTGAVTANNTGRSAVLGGVYGTGDVDILVTGQVATTGDNSSGVVAFVESGRGTGPGDGDIDVQVTSTGGVSTTGKYSDGIVARLEAGNVEGDIDIGVAAGRTVQTAGDFADGIFVANDSGGATTVTVAGTVATALAQANSFAVNGENGGPVDLTVATGGTLRYKVLLSDFDDEMVNNGTFDTAGISRLRAGNDSLLNVGTLLAQRGRSELGGLELFTNRGSIEMRNGATSDRLVVGGNFVGEGGRLSLDVDFEEETADLLEIGGSATGTTIVNVNEGNDFATGFDPILIVDADGDSDPEAFTLAGGNTDAGFVSFSIDYDPEGDDFYLVPGLGISALEFSRYAQLNASVWYRSADAVIAQLASARDVSDGERPGVGSWVQLLDGRADVNGFSDNGGTVFDLGYEQYYTGIQGGLDYVMGGLAFGITGGVGWSNATFEVSGNRIDSDVHNIGAYLTYRGGGFHADLLAKIDWLDAEVNTLGFATDFKAKSYGALLDIGYRFGGDGFWVEPVASIAYVENDIDDIGFGASVAEFDSSHSVRGSAGVRVGGTVQVGGGTFVPFVSARAVDDLEGETVTSFRGTAFSINDDLPGAYGEVGGGASLSIQGFEAFVRGDVQFGIEDEEREVSGHTLRAGIKLRW